MSDIWATSPTRSVERDEVLALYLPPAGRGEQVARWWAASESDADCARRVVGSRAPQGMVWRHCDHVFFLPGFFCRACKAGTPLRLLPRRPAHEVQS